MSTPGENAIKKAIEGATPEPVYIKTKDGAPRAILANAIQAIQANEMWRGVLAFNEFNLKTLALKPPHWDYPIAEDWKPRDWSDHDDIRMSEWLQHQGILVKKDIAGQAVQVVAREISFHPVQAYLDGLKWDETPRLDTWLSYYLGVEDSEYVRAVGPKWMLSAVARIFEPGCKADCALILEGKQGIGKSTALRTLGGEWFTDELAEFGSKDAGLQMCGVWIIEISELGSMSRSDVNHIKASMSRSTDRFRPPYGQRVVESPRQCIFAGTVNGDGYLRDETGGRRFWPVRCTAVDIDALKHDADQLWAEAVSRYRKREPWWIDDPAIQRIAEREQEDRYAGDAWSDPIDNYLTGRKSTSVSEILQDVFHLSPSHWEDRHQKRVAKILIAKGWSRIKPRVNGKRVYRYVAPDGPSGPSSEGLQS
ncbi:MAG: hypothetical protein HQL36_01985 [Alphaproteobacteria bacterium]|nr:hypothetical protein [Alphaproteobacteria bacterium]